MANRVLPQPAEPQRSVGRPCGRPPRVTSSSPRMPVADLPTVGKSRDFARAFSAIKNVLKHQRECTEGASHPKCLPHSRQSGKQLPELKVPSKLEHPIARRIRLPVSCCGSVGAFIALNVGKAARYCTPPLFTTGPV